MRYLKVHVEGCHPGCQADLYEALDDLCDYTEKDFEAIAQDAVNEHIGSWSMELVDEDDVPEGDR